MKESFSVAVKNGASFLSARCLSKFVLVWEKMLHAPGVKREVIHTLVMLKKTLLLSQLI